MMLEPRCCLEALREVFACVAFLLEIGHEKFRDCWVVIDEQEFGGIPVQYFHWRKSSIMTITSISTNLAKLPAALFSLAKKSGKTLDLQAGQGVRGSGSREAIRR